MKMKSSALWAFMSLFLLFAGVALGQSASDLSPSWKDVSEGVPQSSGLVGPDTQGDSFFGGISDKILAPKEQFMPVAYSLFEATPGAAAMAAGTPGYQRGAVTAIVESMRNLTVVKEGAKNAGYWTWLLAMSFSFYGLVHSGIHTFMRVAREGAPVGQSSVSFLVKAGVVIVMFTWIIGGAPRAMIRIVDLMNGFDEGTLNFASASATMTEEELSKRYAEMRKYGNREVEGDLDNREKIAQSQLLPALLMFQNYLGKAKKEAEQHSDEALNLPVGSLGALSSHLDQLGRDYTATWNEAVEFAAYGKVGSANSSQSTADGGNGYWTLGHHLSGFLKGDISYGDNGSEDSVAARAKDVGIKMNLAYFPKIYNHFAATFTMPLQSPQHLSSDQRDDFKGMGPMDQNRLYALFGRIPDPGMAPGMTGGLTDTPENNNSAIMMNAFPPNDIDWDKVRRPSKVVEGALHTASLMLGISIWGMPLALLVWTAMYSLPDQLQVGGVITKSITVAMTVGITGLMLGGAYSWGCDINSPTAETTKLIKAGSRLADITWKKIMGDVSDTDIPSILFAMYIIAIPGIAAKIVQGANGLAEGMTKSLDAGGRNSKLATASGVGGQLFDKAGGFGGAAARAIIPGAGTAQTASALRNVMR